MTDRSKSGPTPRRPRRTAFQQAVHPDADMLQIPGGCDDCNADTEIPDDIDLTKPGLTIITIRHDSTCPWLARREGRSVDHTPPND